MKDLSVSTSAIAERTIIKIIHQITSLSNLTDVIIAHWNRLQWKS